MANHVQAGERIEGGTGIDFFQTGIGSNVDLRPATIGHVERLILSGDSSVTLRGDQLGAGGIGEVIGATSSNASKAIIVQGSFQVDLSGVTFSGWGAFNETVTVNGTFNSDDLTGSSERDLIDGGLGNDILEGSAGDDSLDGGEASDVLNGGLGNDLLAGGPDSSVDTATYAFGLAVTVDLTVTGRQNTGGAGIDLLTGIENLVGSEFADELTGDDDINVLSGFGGNDRIDGGLGIDQLYGGGGSDRLVGGGNSDRLDGGDGNDRLVDASGNDIMNGGAGDDRLIGGISNDTLTGGVGADTLQGGADDDRLIGGLGRDLLVGDAGDDRFDFNDVAESGKTSETRDEIQGFTHLADRIDLSTIDAVAGGSNEAFTFIGASAFTAAGQVRARQSGDDTLLLINTAGTDGAEMTIQLSNFTASTLTAGDLIL